jgi:hypothetical protein
LVHDGLDLVDRALGAEFRDGGLDALTARIIEKITVRSRNEIEIRLIGSYEKAMLLL